MSNFKYTKNWFNKSEIKQKLLTIVSPVKKYNILEIGCFEGQSSVYFSNNLLNHKDSTMDCVDPFYKSGTIAGITTMYVDKKVEQNFDHNISKSQNYTKITVHKTTSDDFFRTNNKMFDFIYIDGCHEPDYIERDLENSFKYLSKNGIMWMDDYGGNNGKCRIPMDSFVKKYKNSCKVIHKGYQLALRKY